MANPKIESEMKAKNSNFITQIIIDDNLPPTPITIKIIDLIPETQTQTAIKTEES